MKFDNKTFKCLDSGFGINEPLIDIVIRPEDINICDKKDAWFSGIVQSCKFKGVYWEIIMKTKTSRIFDPFNKKSNYQSKN